MNVLLDSQPLDNLFQYLASICWGDQYVQEDGMLNAIASYLLTQHDVYELLQEYHNGHLTGLEELVAEFYLDEKIVEPLTELVQAVRDNVAKQLGTDAFTKVKTVRGMVIVSLGEGVIC